jgi:hypothetical protein
VNAKQYKQQRDEAWAVLRKVKLFVYLTSQPYHLERKVGPDSPGGQFTAFLPNGKPVDRLKYANDMRAAVEAINIPEEK